MSFRKNQAGDVVSTDGYTVGQGSRFELQYRSLDRVTTIPIEPGYDPDFFITIYAFAVRLTSSAADPGMLSADDKKVIIERVCASLDFERVRYEVAWSPKEESQ